MVAIAMLPASPLAGVHDELLLLISIVRGKRDRHRVRRRIVRTPDDGCAPDLDVSSKRESFRKHGDGDWQGRSSKSRLD